MSNSYIPKGFIKNIAIGLPDGFHLNNTPFDRKAGGIFIGRELLSKKFVEFLSNPVKKGVFLVTGFRGMGKTSFVNYVLHKYESKTSKKKIIPIFLTMAQIQPTELDILKLITVSLFDAYRKIHEKSHHSLETYRTEKSLLIRRGLICVFILLFFSLIFLKNKELAPYFQNSFGPFNGTTAFPVNLLKLCSYIFVPVSYVLLCWTIVKFQRVKFRERKSQHKDLPYNRIKWLLERCHSNVSEEIGPGEDLNIQGFNANFFSGSEKKVKTYTLSNPKEVEYELNRFLELAKNEVEFIFVFDELDKVDPAISKSYSSDLTPEQFSVNIENAYQHDLRERKQAIINIITSLKNFFTSADARFIFIAGREMFDASLADIADRQSSISSIFTYIFNIESLLKEQNVTSGSMGNASLSAAIETYLSEIILGNREPDFFKRVLDRFGTSPESMAENQKIYFVLQNFVSYLTYRSNGSPKKLIRTLHEFMMVGQEFDARRTIVRLGNGESQHLSVENNPQQLFLYFNYYNQYRIGFISYIYRPFQIQFGRSLKLFSDNIIVSTPYLFDHLIKFHPFAFSLANLELIPEVLSTNKNPSLRDHIRQLIEYLGANHIRETEITLFDYKFFSRTSNEIIFLSKVFEDEAAAYNFTLDESYLVKLLVIGQIKTERKAYSLLKVDNSTAQIYSIAHLSGILGDLHFFDQEYNDAIVAYSDAIWPINNKKMHLLNYRDYITLIKNKLKIGLCFEKMHSYEEALAFYGDCCQDARKFMRYRLHDRLPQQDENYLPNGELINDKHLVYSDSSLNDLLALISQAFIASSIVQEKIGQDGATIYKHATSLGSFLKMVKGTQEYSSRNFQVCANAFMLTGKLYYFKNSPGKIDAFDRLLVNSLPQPEYEQIGVIIKRLNETDLAKYNPSKRRPIIALAMYILSIDEVLHSRFENSDFLSSILKRGNFVKYFLDHIVNILAKKPSILTGSHYRLIAVALSNIGDSLLSMLHMKMIKKEEKDYKEFDISDIISLSGIEMFKLGGKLISFDSVLVQSKENFGITDIIKCYYYSGKFYQEFGRNISYSYQYRKILYVLRLILKYHDSQVDRGKYIEVLQELLIRPILEISAQNTGHTDRHMIQKAKDMGFTEGIQLNLSNHPETQEVHLLFDYIKLKMNTKDKPHETGGYATQYVRLLDLDFHAKEVAMQVVTEFESQEKKPIYNYLNQVTDYFYYMLTILQTLKIYGTDYMVGPSYLAYTHFRIGEFLSNMQRHSKKTFGEENAERKFKQFMNIIKVRLIGSLGKSTFSSLDIIYHYRMAKDLYRKSEQLHQAGNEYKKAIQHMTFLEDDYSDSAYHFGAALDRYKMINNGFQKRIQSCEEFINSYGFNDLFINDTTT